MNHFVLPPISTNWEKKKKGMGFKGQVVSGALGGKKWLELNTQAKVYKIDLRDQNYNKL